MPRPIAGLDDRKDDISKWIHEDSLTLVGVVDKLKTEHNVICRKRTLERNLKLWGFSKRVKVDKTAVQEELIKWFRGPHLTDQAICARLHETGHAINVRTVMETRKKLGLHKRIRPDTNEDDLLNTIKDLLQVEYQDEKVLKMQRSELYSYLRQKYPDLNIVGRDRVFTIARDMNPTLKRRYPKGDPLYQNRPHKLSGKRLAAKLAKDAAAAVLSTTANQSHDDSVSFNEPEYSPSVDDHQPLRPYESLRCNPAAMSDHESSAVQRSLAAPEQVLNPSLRVKSLEEENEDLYRRLRNQEAEMQYMRQAYNDLRARDGLNKPVHDETSPLVSVAETTEAQDHRVDNSGEREFGGAIGVSCMMIGFPLLMYYMWIGATFYSGHIPSRTPGQSWSQFFSHLFDLCYEHAFPHAKAWTIYWTFLIFEGACYLYMPGVYGKGKRLPSLGGKQLEYYCSAVWSWYTTIILAIILHVSGLFPLYTLIDEFGSIMSVAIISGFVVSIIAYFSALSRGAEHRMTGSPIYDFFMGAELNPRLFTWLDFKMFFEVRIPWYILFLTTLGACARQYETYGYVSGEAWFLLMAHFLDMYFEKWGFMLIFWNLAGVPLSYCHCTLYIANHNPSEYAWPTWALTLLFIAYLFVYWIWDTANSQKNMFRAQERGVALNRKTFPQLPYKAVKNPVSIKTKTGDSILCDGWCT
ncbi:sterol reductase/lamin B receptor [Aureobasidium subglaciale]|nr:sterol reductase/lamin B receptor [Aureobasidium subglaciale]